MGHPVRTESERIKVTLELTYESSSQNNRSNYSSVKTMSRGFRKYDSRIDSRNQRNGNNSGFRWKHPFRKKSYWVVKRKPDNLRCDLQSVSYKGRWINKFHSFLMGRPFRHARSSLTAIRCNDVSCGTWGDCIIDQQSLLSYNDALSSLLHFWPLFWLFLLSFGEINNETSRAASYRPCGHL